MNYDEEEHQENYWSNLSLSEFWSKYDVVYQKQPSRTGNIIELTDGSFIRKRMKPAVIRYYLSYGNDEDLARGLLILFLAFRNEKEEIHSQDVKKLLSENHDLIEAKRMKFEKYKLMTELISKIEANNDKDKNEDEDAIVDDEKTDEEFETTTEK